ncbi:RNA polymerase sigma factor [Niastella caeni]|uniref:RNA polymerase sigma factor n=1 Tax=Niastella caeni TaxID=2569763 RepID=UPI00140910CF|nr:RNA polymerase sigma-70 factor [Niastella caeni]
MAADNKNAVSYNEKILFSQVAEGNEYAFGKLFNLFLPKLYPFILKLTRSEAAVQEIIQETFIRVWLNRDKLEEINNPGGWLYKVASNECYSYMRKNALNNKFSYAIASALEPVQQTEEDLDLKELNRLIHDAVNELPEQRKRIYQMSRNQGKSIPEIASELRLSTNTVKNALVTALKFIRKYLDKYDVILSIIFLLYRI